jgi:putative ABC transport system permease protein
MWRDLRYALRLLARSPGFTSVAVLTIALGVGPNTAVFSMVNAVLLRPLPYPHSERLVMIWETWKARGFDHLPVSGPNFLDWKRSSHSFEDMAPAFTVPEYGFNLTAGGEPERAQAAQAAANFFDVVGVRPELGRAFQPEEDQAGGRPVVLLSNSFWLRRFHGDRSIVGRGIGLDGISHTVIGVLPAGVDSLVKVDIWMPIARNLATDPRNNHNFGIMARLKPGVTAEQARKEIDAIASRLAAEHPESNEGLGATVIPISEVASGPVRPVLLVLWGAVGVLLLIACANVAALLLARGAARQREIAIRAAIGAGRGRVLRQVLTESVLLSVFGGAAGLALAWWCVDVARSFVPDMLPRLQAMTIDPAVLVFTLATSVVTGLLFGAAPGMRAARTDLNETLKETGGRGSVTGPGQRLRSVLLTAQIALSLVLLAGAGLLTRSFARLTSVDPGFHPENVLTMHLSFAPKYRTPEMRADFSRRLVEAVQKTPGVREAAAVNFLPMRGRFLDLRISIVSFQIEGEAPAVRGLEPMADFRSISPGFLDALGVGLRAGRNFDGRDDRDHKRVVLINETLARRYFPGQNPIGRTLLLNGSKEIVGVVADIRMNGLEKSLEPAIYAPLAQDTPPGFSMVVRASGGAEALAPAVRRAIFGVDPEQAVADVRTMQQVIDDSLIVRRLAAWLIAIFALLALTLAAVGIYGLVSYSMTQRTHEIGLRVALGASQWDVLRMVASRSIAIALLGTAIGLPAAFALSRLLGGLLYGISAADPGVFLAAPLALVAVAALAGILPARRALRIEPTSALRYE